MRDSPPAMAPARPPLGRARAPLAASALLLLALGAAAGAPGPVSAPASASTTDGTSTSTSASASASASARTAASSAVRVRRVDGVINPAAECYLDRELGAAEEAGAPLVVLELDTPGGLDSSMREMTERLLSSRVPVVVYVSPSGARAASAGMFLTLAAHVAAMAPGTNLGAAHPVSLGGGGAEGGAQEDARTAKVVNDAAALARALAAQRGRNAQWAEQAVRESVSITSGEALARGVIDHVAGDRAQLLGLLDGAAVTTAAGRTVLRTAGVPVQERPMTFLERLLMALIDPNVAYVLFLLGLAGLAAELYSPGALVPGIVGGISIILAFVAFGSLPINCAGALLLALAGALFVAELATSGVGVLGGAGVLALVLGSLLLFSPLEVPSPAAPSLRVSPWVIALAGSAFAALLLFALRAVVQSRRAPVRTGPGALVGRRAVALTELTPRGRVLVDTEEWTAEADPEVRPAVRPGETVRVTGVEGVTLRVRRPEGAALPPGPP